MLKPIYFGWGTISIELINMFVYQFYANLCQQKIINTKISAYEIEHRLEQIHCWLPKTLQDL